MTKAEVLARHRFRTEKGSLLVGITPEGDKVVEFHPLGTVPLDIGYRYVRYSVASNVVVTRESAQRAMTADRRRMAREGIALAQLADLRDVGMGVM